MEAAAGRCLRRAYKRRQVVLFITPQPGSRESNLDQIYYNVGYNYGMVLMIGPHKVEVDRDCLLVWQSGTFTLEHMMAFCAEADKVIAEHGRLFIINHSSAGASYAPDARRYASQWPNAQYVQGAVIFGASFGFSVVISMMTRAIAIFSKYHIPMATVATESEARAWVATRRQKWLASQPNKK